MAITINNANSSSMGVTFGGEDTITITPDGFVSNLNNAAVDAIVASGVGYTFNVNGLIQGFTDDGLVLNSPNFNNIKSKVTVGETGAIFGQSNGFVSSHIVDLGTTA